MRLIRLLAMMGLATLLATGAVPAVAIAGQSVADSCPGYVGELTRARDLLVREDRTAAIAALHAAQTELAECFRRDAGEAGERVLLAASPVPRFA